MNLTLKVNVMNDLHETDSELKLVECHSCHRFFKSSTEESVGPWILYYSINFNIEKVLIKGRWIFVPILFLNSCVFMRRIVINVLLERNLEIVLIFFNFLLLFCFLGLNVLLSIQTVVLFWRILCAMCWSN